VVSNAGKEMWMFQWRRSLTIRNTGNRARRPLANIAMAAGIAVAAGALTSLAAADALAQTQDCGNRGQLDALYCDDDGDLVADAPKDTKRWRNPATLVFAYTPVEDPAVYQNIFKPFTDYLAQCTGKRVVYYPVQSNSAEIEAMRSGRLHVAGFSTGPTGFAVNMAGGWRW
jgi:phosphonate transport system substrate-binding protein